MTPTATAKNFSIIVPVAIFEDPASRWLTQATLQAHLWIGKYCDLAQKRPAAVAASAVINPYADQLTFLDDKTRTRATTKVPDPDRQHCFAAPVPTGDQTVNHAGQKLEYVEVQLNDIETANRLAHEVLGRTLDELPAQTRKLLRLIQGMVKAACQADSIEQRDYRFSRRDIREVAGWSDGQLKITVPD